MTELKRWSNPGSEVDPVVRAVMRYARDLEPSSEQLGALLEATATSRRSQRRWRARRSLWSIAAIAAVFMSGAALAAYAVRAQHETAAAPAAQTSRPAPERKPPAKAPPKSAVVLLPSAEPLPTASIKVAPSPISAPAVTAPSPAPAVQSDAGLLQEARASMSQNPARALTLTRDHELHFPASALTEERQALRVEALARLGRRTEAERELQTFDTRYPRSIYRRRLQGLLEP